MRTELSPIFGEHNNQNYCISVQSFYEL